MYRYLIVILLFLLLGIGVKFFIFPHKENIVIDSPSPTPTPHVFSEEKLWSLIQEWRESQGLSPYIKDQRLCLIAQDRAHDMALSDGQDEHKGLLQKYSSYPYIISENTVYNVSENAAFQSWLNSTSHRRALDKNYQYSCLACDKNSESPGNYCSQIFSSFEK